MNSDPRLTAYALGELEPAEREAFERALAASPELQAELQATIDLSDDLMKILPEESDVLTETQRANLRARVAAPPVARSRRWSVPLAGALAACLAIAAGIAFLNRNPVPPSDPAVAINRPAVPVASPGEVKPGPSAPASVAAKQQAAIKQLLVEGNGYYDRGSYDLAFKRSEQALAIDKSNIPARRLMEKVTVSQQTYAANASAAHETRSRMLWQVAKGWELPVRRSVAKAEVAKTDVPALATTTAVDGIASAPSVAGGVAGFPEPNGGSNHFGYGPPKSPMTLDREIAPQRPSPNTESYDPVAGNKFLEAVAAPLSTFSIDVDTASYANVRRFLNAGQLPPAEAVRLEELINYFPAALPVPEGDAPFSVTTEVSRAPWNAGHLLARIALKGRDLVAADRPASNLVFLVDVSGSMRPENKLPLLKRALRELVQRLGSVDRVAIVTYAGNSGLALPSTSGADQARILAAIDGLESGGSTNGAAGIQLAYDQARAQFLKEGNNRVVLCTDGDFNVGVTSRGELTNIIERERKSGVFLSVLGFGTGNVKDATMENLADRGNGNYAYIDSPSEGRKVLVEQMGATLFTIAKDVKIQVEFNPATVAGYRLIGYENRLLAKEDFNDDTKDAGEIGAGHAVTALYEIVPAGAKVPGQPSVDSLKYQAPDVVTHNPHPRTVATNSTDLFTIKLRFKSPTGDTSKLIEKIVSPEAEEFAKASDDFRFASAAAAFGMKLRGDKNDPTMDWNAIQQIARGSLGEDPGAYRAEFVVLIEKAKQLSAPDGKN